MFRNSWSLRLVMWGLLLSGIAAAPALQETTPTSPETTVPTAEATFSPPPPVWLSPTPDETGAIIVIVQPGDSMWVIAARAGLSLPELLILNGLTENSIIKPGDNLIIGYVTPEVTTPEEIVPTPTMPPPTPRPTEPNPEAAVCLSAFDDLNRNGFHDAAEPLRSGVAFTLYNTQAVVANYITDGHSEPKCLGGLSPGEYRITRSVSSGEILTTEGDWTLDLTAGSELHQAFGSFMGQEVVVAPTGDSRQESARQTPAAPLSGTQVPESLETPNDDTIIPRLAAVIALFLGGLLLLGAVLILLIRQSRNRSGSALPENERGERRFRNIDDLDK